MPWASAENDLLCWKWKGASGLWSYRGLGEGVGRWEWFVGHAWCGRAREIDDGGTHYRTDDHGLGKGPTSDLSRRIIAHGMIVGGEQDGRSENDGDGERDS